jgi:thiol:disulfide interchange protein DsbD
MIRTFLLLLIAGSLLAKASEPISVPHYWQSNSVSQPHVIAELIPETTYLAPGQPFDVILHLHMDPDWHTYWINPGDAGLATKIDWTLPPGFTAGPIRWPTPEKHNMGPLVVYGYGGDVYLLTTITPPKSELPKHFDIKARAAWLVCQEECIPGKADLTLTFDASPLNLRLPVDNKDFFVAARARLPVPNTLWNVTGAYGPDSIALTFQEKISAPIYGQNIYFFPEQANVLSTSEALGLSNPQNLSNDFTWILALQQNGEKPDHLSGVLVSSSLLTGANAKSVYISEFSIASEVAAAVPSGGAVSSSIYSAVVPPLGTAAATSDSEQTIARWSTTTSQPWLIAVLGAAFVGGLILNLMPCVLPVLSLKVFSLMRHAGENPRAAWIQGVAFTAGVVISFWVLAGLLLVLRAAGNQLGWGFQMQSPGFVLALIFIFFLLALNLFGVFELGTSLVGVDAKATNHFSGLFSSFLNGALATLAATPCTAPFMGSSLGFAAQQPPFVALLIFTFLAFGMATPYLLLTIFPGALRFVPKPGAWMEAFKQLMGFLLMATVIFLVYVFGELVEPAAIYGVLFALLVSAMGAWQYGRKQKAGASFYHRFCSNLFFFGVIFLIADNAAFPIHSNGPSEKYAKSIKAEDGWQPWSPAAVDQALAAGHPVFVDFTAAWCLSCKVNERLALDTDSVRAAFAQKNVVLFRADWTHSDPEISKTLRQFDRDGVPLYLLYSPGDKAPRVLPEVLTPGTVLETIQSLPTK